LRKTKKRARKVAEKLTPTRGRARKPLAKKRGKKKTPKGGRPRNSLAELGVTGGYDRNPGRLLKRLGIVGPQTPAEDPELAAAWNKFHADCERDKIRDRAFTRACGLDDRGDHAAADKVLLAAGIAPEIVKQRRDHLNWKAGNA